MSSEYTCSLCGKTCVKCAFVEDTYPLCFDCKMKWARMGPAPAETDESMKYACRSCGKPVSAINIYRTAANHGPLCLDCALRQPRPSPQAAQALVEHPAIAELELKVAQAKIASLNAYVKELETVLEIYKSIVAEGDKP